MTQEAANFVRADLAPWAGDDVFRAAREQQGAIFRHKEGRRTLRFEHHGKSYFLKYHAGVGWKEIIKNLVQFRLPVLGAENEYRAARALHERGVDTLTPAAYGKRGGNPATQESFLVTDDLHGTVSLEDYCKHWREHKPDPRLKRALIKKVAHAAKVMHDSGINHRDFYLCHFLLGEASLQAALQKNSSDFRCYLIDLHRGQIRESVPRRWLVKDLGGLLYSTFDIGLGARDYYRFVCEYTGKPLDKVLHDPLWREVLDNATRLYRKDFGKAAPEVFP